LWVVIAAVCIAYCLCRGVAVIRDSAGVLLAGFERESSDYAEIPDIDNDYASLTRRPALFGLFCTIVVCKQCYYLRITYDNKFRTLSVRAAPTPLLTPRNVSQTNGAGYIRACAIHSTPVLFSDSNSAHFLTFRLSSLSPLHFHCTPLAYYIITMMIVIMMMMMMMTRRRGRTTTTGNDVYVLTNMNGLSEPIAVRNLT